MSRKTLVRLLGGLLVLGPGCINIQIPGQGTLFVSGESFVLRGTTAVIDADGPCRVWIGENGVTYHLFQSVQLSNEDYDRVVLPGTTSRLQLATRSDLTVDCSVGTIVEVERVLEVED